MISRFRLFFFSVLLISTLGFGVDFAYAQITKTLRVELTDDSRDVLIGKNVQIYSDLNQALSFETIKNRLQNSGDQTPQSSHILNLGLENASSWIVFSVNNTSKTMLWYFNLGDLFEGRFSQIAELDVYQVSSKVNYKTRQEMPVFSYKKQNNSNLNPNIPLVIPHASTDHFIVRISTAGVLPTTIVPSIQSQTYSGLNFATHPVETLFFIGIIGLFGAFLGSVIIRRTMSHIGFVGYFASLLLFFVLMQNIPFVPQPVIADIIGVSFCLHMIAGLFAIKNFLGIDARYYTSNLMLYALMAFLTVASLFVLFVPNIPDLLKSVLIFVPCLMSLGAIIIMSFAHVARMQKAAYYFALAWVPVFLGFLITALCSARVIEPNLFFVHAYWLSLPVQAVLFMVSIKFRLALDDTEIHNMQARELYEMQSIERLKKSKDSVDQSRLMRVIERERELMAELREREMKRTEEMRHARNMADEANKAKSGFLAVISHEIRTPLNGLMGTLRLLNDTKMAKDQNDLLGAIHTSCENMMAMLNDLLDFEKIEKGHMTLEVIRFDLEKLVKEVITLMSGHTKGKDLSLGYDMDPTIPRFIKGDPTRLRQILLNLINNAVKFTPSGQIRLSLKNESSTGRKAGQSSCRIRFEVQDSGIGISEEAQRNLFDPFHQADETITRKFGGTGLGLAICKSIVDVMGGTLSVESEEGNGSTFFFTINLEHTDEQGDSVSDTSYTYSNTLEARPAARPLHVLIIEDNEINSNVLSKFLEKNDHSFTVTTSGEDALNSLQSDVFDVILSDVWLPGISGIETAQRIRGMADNKNSRKPIIALTGTTSLETIEEIKRAGMNQYIQKPIDFDQLMSILDDVALGQNNFTAEILSAQISESAAYQTKEEPSAIIKKGEKISPIQQYVQSNAPLEDIGSGDNPAPTDANPDTTVPKDNEETEESVIEDDWYNRKTLQALSDALSLEQEIELFEGFSNKCDEIVGKLVHVLTPEGQKDMNNISLMNWAHELKGMAANFGMTEISDLCEAIEISIRSGHTSEFIKLIGQLTQANENSKKVIAYWIDPNRRNGL